MLPRDFPIERMTPFEKAVSRLINTSAVDCQSTLPHESDLDVLNEALKTAKTRGYKTIAKHIRTRINQLNKINQK